MAGVVIINAREDGAPAQALAEKLGALGLQASFSLGGEMLRDAAVRGDVVIALWSPHSYFRNELIDAAALARDQHRLVHARMQNTPIPNEFEHDGSIDLTGWRGEENFQPWRQLLNAVSGILYAPPPDEHDDSHFVMQDYQDGDYTERSREYVATGRAYDQTGPAEAPLSSFPPPPARQPPQPEPPLRIRTAPGQATARAAANQPLFPPAAPPPMAPPPIAPSMPPAPMAPVAAAPARTAPARTAPNVQPAPFRPAPIQPPQGQAQNQPLQPEPTPRFTPSFPPAAAAALDIQRPPPGVPEFPPFPPPVAQGKAGAAAKTNAAARHPVTPLSSYAQQGAGYRPASFAEPPRRNGLGIVRLLIIGFVTFGVVAGAGIGGYMYLQRNENSGAAATWAALDKTDPYALRQFLDSGNAGQFREPAQATLDTLALDRLRVAREADTIDALQAFLVEFPDSRFAPQVNGRIAELRQMAGGRPARDALNNLPAPQALPPPPPEIRAETERAVREADEPYSPSRSGQPGVYSAPSSYAPPPTQGAPTSTGGPLSLSPPSARDTPASIEDELRRQLSTPPPQR
ncbi:MAG: toll/interleukin-1 receptor domain-containing protein [Hyphomonadaceae bacterium]|nr:toll/interleukin-1 receptor domain-containing protein [Hyphomonadaceae bacterium]